MIRKDIDELIAFLNAVAAIDPEAMGRLVKHRVKCNKELCEHPSVQTGIDDRSGECQVGMLDILNGYGGTIDDGKFKGWGMVAAIMEKDGRCTGFCRMDSEEAKIASAPKVCKE